MSGFISRLSITSILVSSLAMFGCSSSDDGAAAATVPPNAVTITEANAKDIVSQATIGGSTLINLVPVAASVAQAPTASDIIELASGKIKDLARSAALNIPVAEVVNIPCDTGSITGNETSTDTTSSGTITFNACVFGSITLNGTITFSASSNPTNLNWTLTMSGNLSGTANGITTSLNSLTLNQTGNDNTFEYSINTFTYAIDYTGGGGFLVQLLAAIVGNEADTCPRSGIVLVTGADSTKAKGTINGDGTVTIEHDDGSGTFVEVPGSPFPCTDFFN